MVVVMVSKTTSSIPWPSMLCKMLHHDIYSFEQFHYCSACILYSIREWSCLVVEGKLHLWSCARELNRDPHAMITRESNRILLGWNLREVENRRSKTGMTNSQSTEKEEERGTKERRAMQRPSDPQLLAPAGQEEHFEGRFNVKMIKKNFDRSKTVPNTEWCLESWSARRIAGSRSEWIAEGLAFKERVFCLFFWRRFVSKII